MPASQRLAFGSQNRRFGPTPAISMARMIEAHHPSCGSLKKAMDGMPSGKGGGALRKAHECPCPEALPGAT
jgi:hypothetical protein